MVAMGWAGKASHKPPALGCSLHIYIYKILIGLRRESRQLENEIDTKLLSFGKLSSSFLHRDSRWLLLVWAFINCWLISNCSSDKHQVVSNPGHVFETMCLEIEQLLVKVTLRRTHTYTWYTSCSHTHTYTYNINVLTHRYTQIHTHTLTYSHTLH